MCRLGVETKNLTSSVSHPKSVSLRIPGYWCFPVLGLPFFPSVLFLGLSFPHWK